MSEERPTKRDLADKAQDAADKLQALIDSMNKYVNNEPPPVEQMARRTEERRTKW